ncbi:MAG: outer membrane protein assembly factor BamA [Nitrospiria bacterium]
MSLQGEKSFPDWVLALKMFSQKGELYRSHVLQEDIERLKSFYEAEGYLKATVGPAVVAFVEETNEVEIIVSVRSSNKIEVFFEGDDLFPRKRLESLLLIKEERRDKDDVLEESARQIEQFYRREGYPFAKVTAASRRFPEQNRMEAHFKIKSGFRIRIREIRFTGLYAFSQKRLRTLIDLREEGLFKKSLYTEEVLQDDIAALTRFYKQGGFQNVQISSELRFDSLKKFATVFYKIDEGIRTRIDNVAMTGNQALTDVELFKALEISPQAPYNEAILGEGKERLLAAYAKRGYLYADIGPAVHFSLDQTGATATYHITEGALVRLGRIRLEGNVRTKDSVLLREMVIRKGDPYNPEMILESQKRLSKTGLFSVVHFDPIQFEENPTSLDVQLTVKERPSVALEFGLGYGDRERLRGFLEIAHRNLWGTSRAISARAEGSRVEERYSLNYKEPWFLGQNVNASLVASYEELDEVSFDLETFSSEAGLDKRFTDRVKGFLFYQYELKRTTNVAPTAELTPEDIGRFAIATVNPSLVRDSRDDPFNPRSGSVNGIALRSAATFLGSDVELIKATLQSRWFYQLAPKLVFAFSARIGVAERFGGTTIVPLSERFFVGGRSTVRGYDEDKLGIPQVTLKNGQPTGGNAMFVANEELRLFLPKSFGLVLFFDHGNVWKSYRDVSFSETKSTTGIGLRYNTPIGPLRLDWGYKLNREAGEDPSAFHFTLGHAF